MGRLIPAGTGMEYYRNVDVERDETIDQARGNELDEFPDIVGGPDFVTATSAFSRRRRTLMVKAKLKANNWQFLRLDQTGKVYPRRSFFMKTFVTYANFVGKDSLGTLTNIAH